MTAFELAIHAQKLIDDPDFDSNMEVVFEDDNFDTHPVESIQYDGYRLIISES